MDQNIIPQSPIVRHTYRVIYKCPICNRINYMPQLMELSDEEADSLLIQFVKNQLFAGNPALHKVPMHVRCNCPDGSFGLAALAGLERVRAR